MLHAPAATTTVRSAVATVEFVEATPAFARTAVSPANRADKQAARIHMRPAYARSGAHVAAETSPSLVTPALWGRCPLEWDPMRAVRASPDEEELDARHDERPRPQ